jgi:hypothetical protein
MARMFIKRYIGGNVVKKILIFAFALSICVSLVGCSSGGSVAQQKNADQYSEKQDKKSDEKAVRNLVGGFGEKLKIGSLMAPKDTVKKNMQENYGDLVSPTLLKKWQNDPLNAPGRLVSSPWPDRIEILTIDRLSKNAFVVKGEIIEITSAEEKNGGVFAKRPIMLIVKKTNDRWLIDDVTLGAYDTANSAVKENVYRNEQYGFDFSLPASWEGYTIVVDKWEGLAIEGSQSGKAIAVGPMVSIRHPKWTSENKRQDIPIMIFTISQWNSLQKEKFHIGAAPIGPSELGRNAKYVFALPARYNFAFPTGYEEVENILTSKPLKPTNNYK